MNLGRNVDAFRKDKRQFRLIYAAAFAICLLPAVLDVFLPRKWQLLPQHIGSSGSFLGRAKAAAGAAATFGLMGS